MAAKRSVKTSCLKEGDILIARNNDNTILGSVIFLEVQSFTKAGRPRVIALNKVSTKKGYVKPGTEQRSYERIPSYSTKDKNFRYCTMTEEDNVTYTFDLSLNSLYQGHEIRGD